MKKSRNKSARNYKTICRRITEITSSTRKRGSSRERIKDRFHTRNFATARANLLSCGASFCPAGGGFAESTGFIFLRGRTRILDGERAIIAHTNIVFPRVEFSITNRERISRTRAGLLWITQIAPFSPIIRSRRASTASYAAAGPSRTLFFRVFCIFDVLRVLSASAD